MILWLDFDIYWHEASLYYWVSSLQQKKHVQIFGITSEGKTKLNSRITQDSFTYLR